MVRAQDKSVLSLEMLIIARNERQRSLGIVDTAGTRALQRLVGFLRSPGVVAALEKVPKPSSGLRIILESKSDKDLAKVLVGLDAKERQALAKQLKAALGNKAQKVVRLSEFVPKTTTLFERNEIDEVVDQFKKYVDSQWDEGSYLRLEK